MGGEELKSSPFCWKVPPSFILTAVLISVMPILPIDISDEASALTPHDPILIEGDGNFTAGNGVVSGSGTWSDPYVIEGWEIDNLRNYSSAIELRNTSAHFIIRDSYFIGTAPYPWASSGIYFKNVTNGRIENTTSEGHYGVRIENSENNTIENSNVSQALYGLYVSRSTYTTIAGNLARGPVCGTYCGVHVQFSHETNITNNSFEMTLHSICISDSTNTTISDDRFQGVANAIRVESSSGTAIVNTTMTDVSQHGIYIYRSAGIVVVGNTVNRSGRYGVYLYNSTNATVLDNGFTLSGIFMEGVLRGHYNSHTISSDNLVNGLPVRYHKNCSNLEIDGDLVGQLLVANCTNVTVSNLLVADTDVGLELAFVGNATIENNTLLGSLYGLYVHGSSDLIAVSNNASLNEGHGVVLSSSTDTLFEQNIISSNGRQGVRVLGSENVTLLRNDIQSNVRDAVFLWESSRSTVRGNTVCGNGYGVYLSTSTDVLVAGNAISENGNGTYLLDSTNITIIANNITRNSLGIYVGTSEGNFVYHNNITNNSIQAIDYTEDRNRWDDGYPTGGNYWSDYDGLDLYMGPDQDEPGSDGIGDEPYMIDSDSGDRYPLVYPLGSLPSRPVSNLNAHLSGNGCENVTVVWNLSQDDGGGRRDVIGYEMWRGADYDPGGEGYELIGNSPNGTGTYIDILAGEGNATSFFYQVCSANLGGVRNCGNTQAAKFTRSLTEGGNLVSIPLIQSNTRIGHVLQTVKYDNAWRYDSSSKEWKTYAGFKSYGELNHIDDSMGIWINVTNNCNLTVAGMVPAETSIQLYKGWNLVGFPSLNLTYTVADLRAETGATKVEGFDPSASPYFLRVLADGDALQAGHGYWVHVETALTWVVGA